MPYASAKLLAAAAHDLAGSHALTVVTIPALLREIRHNNLGPAEWEGRLLEVVPGFGGAAQKWAIEAFRLRDTDSPYLAVWNSPPTFVRHDYTSSTLQRQRTADALGLSVFINPKVDGKRVGTMFRPDAAAALEANNVKHVSRVSLAAWLGRRDSFYSVDEMVAWLEQETNIDGAGFGDFYEHSLPSYLDRSDLSWTMTDTKPTNQEILHEIGEVLEPATRSHSSSVPVSTVSPPLVIVKNDDDEDVTEDGDSEDTAPDDSGFAWTEAVCSTPLRDIDIDRLTTAVLETLTDQNIHLPDAERLVRRCVVALLVGHLVLQGPPGTGKTTLARALATAFNVALLESTATSEWSPYQVVGGLRPGADGTLEPSYGKVSDAVLQCAVQVRDDLFGDAGEEASQGSWLLIDEFNRADIDKAIGSLYTMLSSVSPRNLLNSPLDLWFEAPGREQLWVPARFRIIAAMNDLDTSFVNPLSQGLTRRFQFITVGTPPQADEAAELDGALTSAHEWLDEAYGHQLSVPTLDDLRAALTDELAMLAAAVTALRHPAVGTAWPVGSAQIVDLLKVTALEVVSGSDARVALDWAVADRLVPQMGLLDEGQLKHAMSVFEAADLSHANAAVGHILLPMTQV